MVNVKFMNPFVEAASEVIKAEVGSEVRRGTLSLQKSAMTTDDITVLISLVGQVQGAVFYGLSKKTGLSLVSKIAEQEFKEFDSLAQSSLAELGNVITARAVFKLSETGYGSNISPPTLIQGRGLQISTLDFSRMMVPLMTDYGEIMVHLALHEAPPGFTRDRNFVPISI